MSTIGTNSEDLILNADGSGSDIKFKSNGTEVGSISDGGVMTATSFAGSGSSLTGLVSTTADNSWTGSQRGTTVTDNDGSFDMDGGNNFKCTPSGNFTLTFTNIANGQSGFNMFLPYQVRMKRDIHKQKAKGFVSKCKVVKAE